MTILAIESSCDETAAAVIDDRLRVLSHAVSSSSELHESFGGIVPELAARAQLSYMLPVLDNALTKAQIQLSSVDAIAVSHGPGLIGSLLVGVETAKTLAFVHKKPLIPVNHVIAHMYVNFICNGQVVKWSNGQSKTIQPHGRLAIKYPAVSLVASGGHTELYLMRSQTDLMWLGGTLDDSAGEAFDKTARLLGFGHGGGSAIEACASTYNPQLTTHNITLPRPLLHDGSLNFSFSGLKTAVLRSWEKAQKQNTQTTDNKHLATVFAYEIQEAITDVLVAKTLHAAQQYTARSILLSGGVAANSRLRDKFYSAIQPSSHPAIAIPPAQLCTDNAVMIGAYAIIKGKILPWQDLTAEPSLSVEKNI